MVAIYDISTHIAHSQMTISLTQDTRPTILLLDAIDLATSELAALSDIANVVVSTTIRSL